MQSAIERICPEADAALADGATMLIISDHEIGPEPGADPLAARLRRRPPAHGPQRHPPAGLAGRRVRRAARDPPPGGAARLRHDRDQPLPDARVDRRDGRHHRRRRADLPRRRDPTRDRRALRGAEEGALEDGDLDRPLLPRRPDLRGGRARSRPDRRALHAHPLAARRDRRRAASPARRSPVTPAPGPSEHGLALPEHVEDGLLPADHAELLPQGGVYRWRRDGERHMWDPQTIASLQRSVRDEAAGPRVLRRVLAPRQRGERRASPCCAACSACGRARSRSRSRRSSRRARSSSASRPAR